MGFGNHPVSPFRAIQDLESGMSARVNSDWTSDEVFLVPTEYVRVVTEANEVDPSPPDGPAFALQLRNREAGDAAPSLTLSRHAGGSLVDERASGGLLPRSGGTPIANNIGTWQTLHRRRANKALAMPAHDVITGAALEDIAAEDKNELNFSGRGPSAAAACAAWLAPDGVSRRLVPEHDDGWDRARFRSSSGGDRPSRTTSDLPPAWMCSAFPETGRCRAI
jgi:hypothetical protein